LQLICMHEEKELSKSQVPLLAFPEAQRHLNVSPSQGCETNKSQKRKTHNISSTQ